ncbi:MAG: 5-formyltetrahydrofolate cyclo-ligase, partial [Bacteroidales bacterium]|nr:5-formyltetrahydrofolate cyclo-ligase [Bacteroidales bacterium]
MKKEERKKQFRKHCLERLAEVSPLKRYIKDKKVLALLYRHISVNKVQSVMLYVPLNAEVNMFPLIKKLRKEQKQLYVPFMEGNSFRLVKYRLPLKKKQFGIKEPNDSKKYRQKNIDLAIVPIVGMDVTHRRVGFGKGMYDRFFEKNNKNIKQVIFVARKLCYSKEIVTDHYDVKADKVFTP